MIVTDNNQQSDFKNTPSVLNRWRFAGLSAADLLPRLQRHLTAQNPTANWQLVWLNNDGQPVIGLLPKVSWSVYFNANKPCSVSIENPKNKTSYYKVVEMCRDKSSIIASYCSYLEWQEELITYSKAYEAVATHSALLDEKNIINQKPSYQHGLIGFIGYDMAAHELSPVADIPQATQPCAVLGHYDIYLSPVKDNTQTSWQLTTPLSNPLDTAADQAIIDELKNYLQHLDDALNDELIKNSNNIALKNKVPLAPLMLKAKWQKNDYEQAFAETQDYLQQGDCYQINLTQAWQGYLKESNNNRAPKLLDYLPSLHANTNAPFAGYLENINFELLSCSPELFFTFTTDQTTNTRHIITKPIKGTMPRGESSEQDNALKQQLITSDKDRSENVMIVDLLRNDLGRYAKTGSVKVPKLFAIESFSNVHHMVSTITAELKEQAHPLAVLFGSLPAGSITGTPKKRAVEIIAELEGAARGAYCGTMGYMNFDGSGQWNVLIRTLQAGTDADNKKQVSLWAGGGITIASNCVSEYQECLDKVGNLLGVLAQSNSVK
ncbi:anthranilate synthase component I family protein [Psychrobacter sp. M13]|uniref:anthranilate synthase component I family protein n=1 Tax=Psychrobacter sp. M13 TaxID=3067275 RepID=UPI00273B0B70|nr:anthranilate synthase component I family protein [Psychrobacter sp. M13]WLP94218.1 anthranilate synthase component I family protein [Psychrobacter sp. M13]